MAYIDLNSVRAGIVADPAEYRWRSYGEAVSGGPKGNGKKAREGLARAKPAPHLASYGAHTTCACGFEGAGRRNEKRLGVNTEPLIMKPQ